MIIYNLTKSDSDIVMSFFVLSSSMHSVLLQENLRHVYVIVFFSNSPGVERRAMALIVYAYYRKQQPVIFFWSFIIFLDD